MIELCTKEVSWLLSRGEDWLRHSRSDKTHWITPPHHRDGRRVYYLLDEVLDYANKHGIKLPRVTGGRLGIAMDAMSYDANQSAEQLMRVRGVGDSVGSPPIRLDDDRQSA